ncbi:MAG: insulinase family protein [Parachlamydiales bacterium]
MKFFLTYFLLFTFSVFSISAQEKQYQIIEDQSDLTILNPSLKDRKFLKLRLSNGLKVYLISDKKAEQSAAAISVLAGSWDDPKEYPGMAHFCEHMLFKGSKKYPKESDYFKFIMDNSGTPNAFTAPDRTVYMFSINHKAFDEALDRLSHFFKDPLMETSHIAKELYAVDQEHSKNLENDYRRVYSISKEIGNPSHPNAKFSTGNAKTLGSIPPSELRKWFQSNYSANLMALTVYSNLEIDEMIKMVTEKFSQIPNIGKDQQNIKENLFSKNNLGKIVYVKPISNLQILDLEWELNGKFSNDDTKSSKLIAYTLKRGQKNSLLEVLKSEHLAEDVNISFEKMGCQNSIFSISVKLTDLGIKKVNEVISRCFESLNNLKSTNIPSYLFNEMQSMERLNYQYQAHEDPFEFVCTHSYNLLDEDISTYPQKTILATRYNPKTILDILSTLTYSNCQFFLIADPEKTKVATDRKEKWTDAEYTIKELNKDLLANLAKGKLNQDIRLPSPNLFIPTNLQIVASKDSDSDEKNPAIVVNDDFGKIYYLKDDKYETPQISWHFKIKDKAFDNDLKSIVLKDIYIKSLNENLAPIFYSAQAAGLNSKISSDKNTFKIEIFGFSEKAPLLLEEILKTINSLDISKDLFEIYYSSINKDYENEQKVLPISQAKNYLSYILTESSSIPSEKLKAIKNITYKDFIEFKQNLFKNTYVEGFLSGNINLKDTESVWFDIKDVLCKNSFSPKDHYKNQIFVISDDSGPYFIHQKIPQLGNGVILAIDQGSFSFKNRACQNILAQAIREAFFTELRSEQKTAYIAVSNDLEIEKRLFQTFAVQSNSHDVLDLLSRFELFLETYLSQIKDLLPKERFENIKSNIIETLSNPYNNLEEMSSVLNKLAFEYEGDFLWLEKRIEALKALSYEDFISFVQETISKENKKRLAILQEGKIEKEFKYKEIKDLDYKKIGYYQTEAIK